MISEAIVRSLAKQRFEPAVSTLYLDVDGRHRPVAADYEAAFRRLAAELARRAERSGDPVVVAQVERDAERMRGWLRDQLDRSATRGVAMFACAPAGFFEVVPVARAVRDEVALAPTPGVAQLVALVDEHERFVVVLVDNRRLRLFRFELGELEEEVRLTDWEERSIDTSVELGSFEHHDEEAVRMHHRRAADAVERALQHWPAERLIVGGPDEAVAGLQSHLSEAVTEKIAGRVGVRVSAPAHEIVEAALDVEEGVERQREQEMVELLRQRVAGGHRAVVGLDATLDALSDRRVSTLLVSEGFTAPGARCPSCGHLGVDLRQCPVCGATNVDVDDIVAVAIEEAVAQHTMIEFCHETDLDRFGRIGALERF